MVSTSRKRSFKSKSKSSTRSSKPVNFESAYNKSPSRASKSRRSTSTILQMAESLSGLNQNLHQRVVYASAITVVAIILFLTYKSIYTDDFELLNFSRGSVHQFALYIANLTANSPSSAPEFETE